MKALTNHVLNNYNSITLGVLNERGEIKTGLRHCKTEYLLITLFSKEMK